MPTTGGALAFADLMVPYDATLTRNLKAAGAIILAKTQLTELANWIASGMPANYNGLNGYGMNPWDPRREPRDNVFESAIAHAPWPLLIVISAGLVVRASAGSRS